MLEVDAAVLVARERRVARDHRGLGDGRYPPEAERRADRALVHGAAARERRVLLVKREHAAAQALVLQRLLQRPGALDRLTIVGEAERALVCELGHLRELLAFLATRDRGQEAD